MAEWPNMHVALSWVPATYKHIEELGCTRLQPLSPPIATALAFSESFPCLDCLPNTSLTCNVRQRGKWLIVVDYRFMYRLPASIMEKRETPRARHAGL